MEKECFKCGRTLPLTEFYRHGAMADGHLGKCKGCTRLDVRAHRRKSDSVREYDRARGKLPHRKEAVRRRHLDRVSSDPAYRAQHKARVAVGNALRDGRLQKEPCEVCGDANVHGHHDDYSKPLDVRWLCPVHHARHHAKETATKVR